MFSSSTFLINSTITQELRNVIDKPQKARFRNLITLQKIEK